MKSICLLMLLGLLSACASENVRVHCDGKLQPINPPPTLASHPSKSDATSSPSGKPPAATP